MNDNTIKNVIDFRDDRDWKKYHNGKDLAISISLEANELLEIYQWSNTDLDDIINEKLKKNLIKYPKNKKVDLTKK